MTAPELEGREAWSYCYSHSAREAIPPEGAHAICLECGHVYVTEADLVAAYNAAVDDINRRWRDVAPARHITAAEQAAFCQECLHDF